MECKDQKAKYISCGKKIYDPHTETCVQSSEVDATNYCQHRPDGNYNWPWDCHKYVNCSNHNFFPLDCQPPGFVYHPNTNQCQHPQNVKCIEIKGKYHLFESFYESHLFYSLY